MFLNRILLSLFGLKFSPPHLMHTGVGMLEKWLCLPRYSGKARSAPSNHSDFAFDLIPRVLGKTSECRTFFDISGFLIFKRAHCIRICWFVIGISFINWMFNLVSLTMFVERSYLFFLKLIFCCHCWSVTQKILLSYEVSIWVIIYT